MVYWELCERLLDRRTDFGQARFNVSAKMDAQGPPIPLRQHLKITSCLGRFDNAEGVFLPRNGQVLGIITSHLQEQT